MAWAQAVTPLPAETEPGSAEYGAVATATRMARPVREVPSQVSVLERADLEHAPSLTTDSLLRALPAVATFRRSTSLSADPSSQGLNLRGVGPSGVSRTLVLMDGVPANDPFGGWIYWRALPRLGLERVEVSPGGSSALYGSAALSGVVELHPRTARENAVQSEVLYGSLQTLFGAARVAHDFGAVGAALEGEWLSSEGFPIVSPDQRGPIDGPTPSAHGSVQARVEAPLGSAATLWLNALYFHEDQNGGTRLTKARVGMGSSALGADVKLARGGLLKLSGFGRFTRFEQQRARIAPERLSESLSARQDVPARDEGGALVYQSGPRSFGGVHKLAAGLDLRHITAESRERLFSAEPSAMSPARRDIEGRQLLMGVYLQDFYKVRPWLGIDAAVRFSWAQTYDAARTVTTHGGERSRSSFENNQSSAFSPRLGAFFHASERLTLRGAGYQSFRVPTLNELYRPFQVGTVLTAANERLSSELLLGGELGADWQLADGLIWRTTAFWNRLERPIVNATLEAPDASGASRRRVNLDDARVRGAETALEWRLARRLSSVLAYTLVDARVTDAGPFEALAGKRLAQDPVHRAALSVRYDDASVLGVLVQLRFVGRQYEDDLNTLPMEGAWLLDASISRVVAWPLEAYVAAENLLDQRYLVGRAGVDTLGQPFAGRLGLRVRRPRRRMKRARRELRRSTRGALAEGLAERLQRCS